MRKTFLGVIAAVILSSVLFVSAVSATDICSNDPLSSADYNVEVTSAVFLRDISCMMESNVIATLPAGEVVHVIGRTEGWHKIERADGSTGWLWETFVKSTTKPFNAVGATPEPEPEPIVEPEPVVYSPMYDISGYKYETAIWYVYNQGIVGGYEDGSYQANRVINRAELLKIIVEAAYDNEFESYSDESCFSDVPAGKWYTPYVCFAKSEGIVQGYSDGSFKPAAEINFVEALKIAMVGFGNEYTEGDPWYKDIVELGGTEKAIPIDIKSFSTQFTRGQMAEMITRVMKKQDGLLEDYLGADVYANYNVDYSSIDEGVDVEDLVGTGKCISTEGAVYNSGDSYDLSECTTCMCSDGNWLCMGLCMPEEETVMTFTDYVDEINDSTLEPVNVSLSGEMEDTAAEGMGSIFTAEVILHPCTADSYGQCDVDMEIYAASDWDTVTEDQDFYFVNLTGVGITHYGPFTGDLQQLMQEAEDYMTAFNS